MKTERFKPGIVWPCAGRWTSQESPRSSRALEALKDGRARQHSIRINNRYRLSFVWDNGDAYEVEIVDYHVNFVARRRFSVGLGFGAGVAPALKADYSSVNKTTMVAEMKASNTN